MIEKIQALFDSLSRKQLVLLAIVSIVCICVMGYYLYRCINPIYENFEEEVDENLSGPETFSNNEVVMRMFHVNWCGYCKSAKPHYTEFKNSIDGKTINGRVVKVELIDFEDKANEDIVKQFESVVEGYPTIILTIDGKNNIYQGDRESASSYITYLKEMLA